LRVLHSCLIVATRCDNVKNHAQVDAVANTYSYLLSHSLEACASELADAGFARIEAMIGPGHLWPDALDHRQRVALRRFLEQRGVEVVTLNQPNLDLNLVSRDDAMRAHSLHRFEQAVLLAADLGCARVVVGPGKANPLLPSPSEHLAVWLVQALESLQRVAQPLGVRILLENMPFAFLPRLDDLLDFLRRLEGLEVGLVYDIANGWFVGEDPVAALARGAEAIEIVHVSDTGRDRYAHAPIGEGTVPWQDVGRGYALLSGVPVVAEIVSMNPASDLVEAFVALRGLGWPVAVGR
jgi:L-ribulose-5-phosphate 3-epimerase